MADIVERFAVNPILRPADIPPSHPELEVACVLNPGAFRYGDRIGLLLRVAERPRQEPGWIATPVVDEAGRTQVLRFRKDDPKLSATDARVFSYDGTGYLTTLSHLRLAWSDDGERFGVEPTPAIAAGGPLDRFGVEDCRVTLIDGTYYLTFTSVSDAGVAVGMARTTDWKTFTRDGLILPPHNKDCALLDRKIGGRYFLIHRPSGIEIGGNDIWLAGSPDLHHWGDHRCLLRCRPGKWDGRRIGVNSPPIETERGWLMLYHGADARHRYCLGAALLDRDEPWRVLARTAEPYMEPTAAYELQGFFGNVVFSNGHVRDGDRLTLYYGASDEFVCGATTSIRQILDQLK